jgi:hypothetical protein
MRVSVIVATDNSSPFNVCNGQFGAGGVAFINSGGSLDYVFPYRDYGPMIQQEVWVRPRAAGSTVFTVTEIYRIQDC